ncbi:MAG: anthranilate phosphoribosyltransferase family protein [Cyanobacteriota bacterium]|nr:anthranilate phosphoribosyltransferase family protein [Cyanobacteriota bacterium]
MSDAFRELLKKVGSGVHTGKDLSRDEAAAATRMMLEGEATPAQIGAFAIAHRIKRPTPEELLGMLDAYDLLGPKLSPLKNTFLYQTTVFGNPYDGRSRTAPVMPVVSLILRAAGVPVVLHGGARMPTKYGIPAIEIWQGLGVDFAPLNLEQTQQVFQQTGLGLIYLPQHFPHAQGLVPYRDQIGKRPPFATAELIWSPYAGDVHLVAGYVHPPTEERFREVFDKRGIKHFTLVKGLEGSCDLPCDRTAIISVENDGDREPKWLKLHPREYGFAATEVPLESKSVFFEQLRAVLGGHRSPLTQAAIWSGGFYLWRCGVCPELTEGLAKAETLLMEGYAAQQLDKIKAMVSHIFVKGT